MIENSAKKIAVGSEGVAEGGFGGNSAFPLRNQIEASPATCLNTWKAEHRRKILFSLKEEKSGARKMKRAKSIFLWCGEQGAQWRGWLPYWGFAQRMFELRPKNTEK